MRFSKVEAWSFGKSKKKNNLNNNPGPSEYDIKNNSKRSPSWK